MCTADDDDDVQHDLSNHFATPSAMVFSPTQHNYLWDTQKIVQSLYNFMSVN